MTGVATNRTELDAGSPSPAAVKADRTHRKPSGDRRRHAGSHSTVRLLWIRCATNVLLGRPSRQGAGSSFDPRLILMGVWRDPSCVRSHKPKKRTRFEDRCLKKPMTELAAGAAKKLFAPLDERPANGCHRNSRRRQRAHATQLAHIEREARLDSLLSYAVMSARARTAHSRHPIFEIHWNL